jgi:hypothetical protein
MANRIHATGTYRHEEAKAGEAGIYPGMLVKYNSAGAVIKHATEGGALGDEVMVAAEDALQGNSVETVYANGDIVSIIIPNKGSEVRLLAEAGTSIGIADKLHSAGDGTVQEASAKASSVTIAAVVGVATEAVDLSASSAVDTLVKTRIV